MKKRLLILLMGFVFTGYGQTQLPFGGSLIPFDSCEFAPECSYVNLNDSAVGCWVIGKPHKTPFDTSDFTDQVLITDSVQSYPSGTRSVVGLNLPDQLVSRNFAIAFRHRYETDAHHDGGFLEISYDSGNTWTNVIRDSINLMTWFGHSGHQDAYGSSDTLPDGTPAFTGSSDGWKQTFFYFVWYIPLKMQTSTLLRFVFVSDSADNQKAGWMIDNLRLYDYFIPGGFSPLLKEKVRVYPNPATGDFVVQLSEERRDWRVKLYSADGQCHKTTSFQSGRERSVERGTLEKGLYIYTIEMQGYEIAHGKIMLH